MKTKFWIEKWQKQQTGFHKSFTHPLLVEYIDKLNIHKGDTIFVPLCGKTVDMLWLNSQGFQVLGVELSAIAIEQFFSDNELVYVKSKYKNFTIYTYENITIYQGDFFALDYSYTKNIQALYDRAALIALPDDMVVDYVNKMRDLLNDGVKELLITLEFKKTSDPTGPPFSTSDAKIYRLFADYGEVKLMQEIDIIDREPKFKAQGCNFVYERAYLVTV